MPIDSPTSVTEFDDLILADRLVDAQLLAKANLDLSTTPQSRGVWTLLLAEVELEREPAHLVLKQFREIDISELDEVFQLRARVFECRLDSTFYRFVEARKNIPLLIPEFEKRVDDERMLVAATRLADMITVFRLPISCDNLFEQLLRIYSPLNRPYALARIYAARAENCVFNSQWAEGSIAAEKGLEYAAVCAPSLRRTLSSLRLAASAGSRRSLSFSGEVFGAELEDSLHEAGENSNFALGVKISFLIFSAPTFGTRESEFAHSLVEEICNSEQPLSWAHIFSAYALIDILTPTSPDLVKRLYIVLSDALSKSKDNIEYQAAIRFALGQYHLSRNEFTAALIYLNQAIEAPGRHELAANLLVVGTAATLGFQGKKSGDIPREQALLNLVRMSQCWDNLPYELIMSVERDINAGEYDTAKDTLRMLREYLERFKEAFKGSLEFPLFIEALEARMEPNPQASLRKAVEASRVLHQAVPATALENRFDGLSEEIIRICFTELGNEAEDEIVELRKLVEETGDATTRTTLETAYTSSLAARNKVELALTQSRVLLDEARNGEFVRYSRTAFHYALIALAANQTDEAEKELTNFVDVAGANIPADISSGQILSYLVHMNLAQRRFTKAHEYAQQLKALSNTIELALFRGTADDLLRVTEPSKHSGPYLDLEALVKKAKSTFFTPLVKKKSVSRFASSKIVKFISHRWIAFVITAIFFITSIWYQSEFVYALLVTGAVLFHELGHVLAMRYFGCANTKILFIPFLGALAQGLPSRALSPVESFVVAAAGPIPGLTVALLVDWWFAQTPGPDWVMSGAGILLALNWFNLIPVAPLDGSVMLRQLGLVRKPLLSLILVGVSLVFFCLMASQLRVLWLIALVLGIQFIDEIKNVFSKRRMLKAYRNTPLWKEARGDINQINEFLLNYLQQFRPGSIPQFRMAQYLLDAQSSARTGWWKHFAMCFVLFGSLFLPLFTLFFNRVNAPSAGTAFVTAYQKGDQRGMEEAFTRFQATEVGAKDTRVEKCFGAALIAIEHNSIPKLETSLQCLDEIEPTSDDLGSAYFVHQARMHLAVAVAEAKGDSNSYLDAITALEKEESEME